MPASFVFTLISPDGTVATSLSPSSAAIAGQDAFRDFATDPATGDLETVEGDFPAVAGAAGVASDLQSRLQTFTQEWFLNPDMGVPRSILGSKFQKGRIEQIYRTEILACPGVAALTSLVVAFAGRTLSITFRVTTDFGEIIEATLTNTGG